MFRAIKCYDGSTSDKRIDLQTGDLLSAVHALDETWFIGYNERTGQTGAFPIECVEDCRTEEEDKPESDAFQSDKEPPKPMYANVSADIQKRKDSLDLSPVERARTLSNKANKFDPKRLVGAKPEIKYRLKLVKKDTVADKGGEEINKNDEKSTESIEEQNGKDHSAIFTVKQPDENKDSTLQRVRFSSVNLEHSVSVPESTASWQESSFEHSDTWTGPEDNATEGPRETESSKPKQKEMDGKYHKFDKVKASISKSRVLQIISSGQDENKVLKAMFGAIAGVIIGGLLFLVLVYSFDYTMLEAGIIVALSTIVISVCLAFSTLCRCVMALIFPNFFTGKGRTVLLSIIFGVLLSHPVANITYNAEETGHSFSCMAELARNQTLALQRQLAKPIEDLVQYVEEQNRRLTILSNDINGAFSTGAQQIDDGINEAQGNIRNVVQQCKSPMQQLFSTCRSICGNVPFIGGDQCKVKCKELSSLDGACNKLADLATEINKAANGAKDLLGEVKKFFTVNVKLNAELSGESNTTKSVKRIQEEVNEDIAGKAHAFEIFIVIVKKVLSLSIALLFLQSFWYLRNYLAKDDYDNIYITSQFKALDKECESKGRPSVLPLKKKEKSIYVDPSSIRPNTSELAYCKIGLAQVILHFILCLLLLLFDFALYYILYVVRKYGDVDLHVKGQGHFDVSVEGSGPVALFYGVLIQGMNIHGNFTAKLEIGKCLPNPRKPSVSIIPVLIILYLIALGFVLLRGYGMRLRRKIAAFFFPDQEMARLEYLHKKVRHKRIGMLKLIRHLIKSSHKETTVKEKLRLSTWISYKIPFLGRFLVSKNKLVCTSCEHSESSFNDVRLTKCSGSQDGIACDAVYCQDCWAAINHSCPLCSSDEQVVLRE